MPFLTYPSEPHHRGGAEGPKAPEYLPNCKADCCQRLFCMNREILFLYISPLLLASTLTGILTYYIWCHRTIQGAVPLMILGLSAAEWSLSYALELVTAQSSIAIVLAKLQ